MNQRRPPSSNPDSTALLERPDFSDAGDTDPNRKALARAEAATGRFDANDVGGLDGFRPSELPSAYVSEFDVSDLDGDVVEAGAATTIMQLPPEMMSVDEASFAEASDRAVELLKWRAGPVHARPAFEAPELPDLVTLPTLSRPRLEPAPLPPAPPSGAIPHMAATQPGLSVEMVRAAVRDRGSAPRFHDEVDSPTASSVTLAPVDRLRTAVDDALAAVLAAQSCADDGDVPVGVHDHLARAVELLSAAQELGEEL